jgi:hypothetical protein
MRRPDNAKPVDQPDRCEAIVKWVNGWRCLRTAALNVDGHLVCKQHDRSTTTVPDSWEHWRNERDVICCNAVGAKRKLRA